MYKHKNMKRKTLILNVIDNNPMKIGVLSFTVPTYELPLTEWKNVCGNFDHAKNQIMIEKSYLVSFHEVSDRRDSKIK